MDAGLKRVLGAIDAAAAEVAGFAGPMRLSDEYLRAVERVEALPQNQTGADKTWLWQSFERDRVHFARAERR